MPQKIIKRVFIINIPLSNIKAVTVINYVKYVAIDAVINVRIISMTNSSNKQLVVYESVI